MKTAWAHALSLVLGPVAALLACAAFADGTLDASFGHAGQVLVERPGVPPTADALPGDVTVMADGKSVWIMENGASDVIVGRLNRDGRIDASFGDQGQVRLSTCARRRPTRVLAAADDAVVVWAGACLVRLNATGAVDPTFGASATSPPTATLQQFRAAGLARDTHGRIVLGGSQGSGWQVWRFLADGSNDISFGTNGVATVPNPDGTQQSDLTAMQLRANGSVVLAGTRSANFKQNLRLAQLDANGLLESGFGTNGITEVVPPASFQGLRPEAVALDRNGSLLVAGSGSQGTSGCCVLIARFGSNGALVPGSLRLFDLGPDVSLNPFGETASALSLMPDGKILLARNSFPPSLPGENGRTRFTMIRMQASGALDSSFDLDGWRSYLVTDTTNSGASGAYSQLHAVAFGHAEALMFGRTFFEDNGPAASYTTLMRVQFDALYSDGFELGDPEHHSLR